MPRFAVKYFLLFHTLKKLNYVAFEALPGWKMDMGNSDIPPGWVGKYTFDMHRHHDAGSLLLPAWARESVKLTCQQ